MLHDLQRGFADVALANKLAPLVADVRAAKGTTERRLGVYRNNTVNSLTNVLKAAYPVLERIVGERFFRGLALAFIEAHPPQQPTLFRYGGDLATFLESFPPAQQVPYLADVARLEWARIESYFAADRGPLDPHALAAIDPEELGDVRFTMHPSIRLVESSYPVFEVWSVNQGDQKTIPKIDFERGEHGFVLRRDNIVSQRILNASDYKWLWAIARGVPLGPATAQALELEQTFDLQNILQLALAEGVFTDVLLNGE